MGGCRDWQDHSPQQAGSTGPFLLPFDILPKTPTLNSGKPDSRALDDAFIGVNSQRAEEQKRVEHR